jgi:hypothetical protein
MDPKHTSKIPRLLLLIPTTSYRTHDFLDAAERLGVEVAVGSNQTSVLSAFAGGRTTQVDFVDPDRAVDQIEDFAARFPLAAIVGVDEGTTTIAAIASDRLCSHRRARRWLTLRAWRM